MQSIECVQDTFMPTGEKIYKQEIAEEVVEV
jgi:hypothetical protein